MSPHIRLERLAAAAVDRLPTDGQGRIAFCDHLPDAGIGAICGLHPEQIACHACFRKHFQGHGVELEHTCDACHCVTRRIYGAAIPWVARLRTPGRGVDRLMRVYVGALGLCPSCYARAKGVAA